MSSHSRGAFRPSFASSYDPLERQRAQGRPGGRCTRGSRARMSCASAKTTGTGGDNRPSLRGGLRLIRALLGEPFRLPPSSARCASIVANLAPDIGAPGPHDFAVRKSAARQSAPPRPPHPRLTFRDDRDTPLATRRDEAKGTSDLRKSQWQGLRQVGTTGRLRMPRMQFIAGLRP
jgi:hypothetical protein